MARLEALLLVLVVGCTSSPPNAPDTTVHDAAVDEAAPPGHCGDATTPPTTSFDLAAWPALAAATGPDLSASAGATTAPLSVAPAGVVVTHDGAWVLAALRGAGAGAGLGVMKRTGASVALDHVIASPPNQLPFGVAQSDDGATLAVSLSDEIALYDLAKVKQNAADALIAYVPDQSAKKTTIDVAFSRDGRFVFAALEYDRAVAVIDVGKRAWVGAVPIAGNAVTGVVVSPDGARLYATCEVADEFLAANPAPATDQVVGSITVVDVATAETSPATAVVGRAFVGRAPVRAALSPDGATLWVTVRGSNAVVALDTANLLSRTCDPLIATTAVGPAPVGLALLKGGKYVAVANSNRFAAPQANQTVSFVAAAQATLVGQVGAGAFPREMDADLAALFVSNANSLSVTGIDLTTLALP